MTRIFSKLTIVLLFSSSLFSCGDTGVSSKEDATDFDAIYNIIRYDKPDEFNVDLIDFSIPDTLVPLLSDIIIDRYWYVVDSTQYAVSINIENPDQNDSLGAVPTADVIIDKRFLGNFEIIGRDTTGGQNTPVRDSTRFGIQAIMTAQFERFGFYYNYRRGWLLSKISNVSYFNIGTRAGEIRTYIDSPSYNHVRLEDVQTPLSDVVEFSPGDSVTVTIQNCVYPFTSIRYDGGGGFTTQLLAPDSSWVCTWGFRVSSVEGYYHFLVDQTNPRYEGDSLATGKSSRGYLYRVKQN